MVRPGAEESKRGSRARGTTTRHGHSPFHRDGWRCGIASVTKEKAIELWQQCQAIGEASGLAGTTYGRVPRIVESRHGRVDILSADRNAGHVSGFDEDEIIQSKAGSGTIIINRL